MRIFVSVTLLITTFLFFSSCQKEIDFDPSNPAKPSTGELKAKFDGTQWIANKGAGAYRMQGFINISGGSIDKKYLTITLVDSGVHKYVLSDASFNVAAFVDSTEANQFSYSTNEGTYPTQAGGDVTITAIDTVKKTVSGTFSFKLFREMDGAKKTVTEGSFTNLTYQTTMPATAATDTFNVKIDGSPWTPSSVTGMFVPMMNQIAINATDATATKAVGLVFPSNITAGSYALDFFGATYMGQYNPDNNPMHSKASSSGTLTILEHNTSTRRIRGNFNFRAEELLNSQNFANISEGYFSVTY